LYKKDNDQHYNYVEKPDKIKAYSHYQKETVPVNWLPHYRKGKY